MNEIVADADAQINALLDMTGDNFYQAVFIVCNHIQANNITELNKDF